VTVAAVYFEGAGGSTCGLRDAGFVTVGFEYWQTAVDTARANGHTSCLHDLSDAARDVDLPHTPVAWFSPPCQPFSAAGDGEGEFDDRDGFPWTLRIIARTLPAVVFIENVKGLTFAKHSDYFGGVLAAIRALGYEVDWKVLNTADFGVPQTRERCIIIARRDGGRIVWPAPTHTEQPGMFTEQWVSLAAAVPSVARRLGRDRRGKGMTERHADRPDIDPSLPAPTIHRNTEKDLLFVRTNQISGADYYRRTIDDPCPSITTMAGRNWWVDRPATTINGDPRVSAPGRHDPEVSGSQQADAIRLTIPELATLQGFPPGYIFTGTKTAQAKQVGNAVPPRLAQVVAEANRPIRTKKEAEAA
jgi:DNA (cytosine-5)-methyltransferase 1